MEQSRHLFLNLVFLITCSMSLCLSIEVESFNILASTSDNSIDSVVAHNQQNVDDLNIRVQGRGNDISNIYEQLVNNGLHLSLNGTSASKTSPHEPNSEIFHGGSRNILSVSKKFESTYEKEVVTVVLFDKIKGYLNWMQDWFLLAARENCSTTCIVTASKINVR